jgi:hypothetical protein
MNAENNMDIHTLFGVVTWGIALGFALVFNFAKRKKWSRSSVAILHVLFFGTLTVTGTLFILAFHALHIQFDLPRLLVFGYSFRP